MSDKKPIPAKNSSGDSRELLLEAAKRVFAAKGFDGATVKDLADAAGVNVSLVSYHFGGKENLYRTCLEGFGQARLETAERILKPAATEQEFVLRLRLFGEDFLDVYRRDPSTCKMVNTGIESMNSVSFEVFKSTFLKIFDLLIAFIESARENKIVSDQIDPHLGALMMFGSLMHLIHTQEMATRLGFPTLNDNGYAEMVVNHWIQINTLGVFPRANSTSTDKGASHA